MEETEAARVGLTLASTLSGHVDRCWHLSLHPTLPLLSSSSTDQTVNVYDTDSSTLITTLKGQHSRSIRASSWKPSNQPVLATASFDGSAGIWHPECEDGEDSGEWECVATLEGHENECKCVAWSSDGRYLATCSRDKSVWVWEGTSVTVYNVDDLADEEDEFECLAVLQEHTQDVKSVAWHPTEPILASCSYDDTIRLYYPDQDEFIPISILRGHTSTVWGVAFEPILNSPSPEDPDPTVRLASCSDDLSIVIWHRTDFYRPPSSTMVSILRDPPKDTWKPLAILPRAHERAIYSVAWSKSGLIASTGGDGKIVVYEEVEGKWRIKTVQEAAHGVCEVNCVIWGRPENILWSAGDDGLVKKWQL